MGLRCCRFGRSGRRRSKAVPAVRPRSATNRAAKSAQPEGLSGERRHARNQAKWRPVGRPDCAQNYRVGARPDAKPVPTFAGRAPKRRKARRYAPVSASPFSCYPAVRRSTQPHPNSQTVSYIERPVLAGPRRPEKPRVHKRHSSTPAGVAARSSFARTSMTRPRPCLRRRTTSGQPAAR